MHPSLRDTSPGLPTTLRTNPLSGSWPFLRSSLFALVFSSQPLHPHSSHSVSLEFSSTLRLTPPRRHTCSGMASPPLCSELLLFIPQNLTRVSLPLRSLPGSPGLYAGVTQTVLVFHSVEHICSGFQGGDSSYCHDPWEMKSPDRGPQCSHER